MATQRNSARGVQKQAPAFFACLHLTPCPLLYINLSRYCDEKRKTVKIRCGRATVIGTNPRRTTVHRPTTCWECIFATSVCPGTGRYGHAQPTRRGRKPGDASSPAAIRRQGSTVSRSGKCPVRRWRARPEPCGIPMPRVGTDCIRIVKWRQDLLVARHFRYTSSSVKKTALSTPYERSNHAYPHSRLSLHGQAA